MLCVDGIFRSHQVQEVERRTFPGNCFFSSPVLSLLCSSQKAKETLTTYLSFIPPPSAGWQLLWGYHTHSGKNCCSMDFKQTWNRQFQPLWPHLVPLSIHTTEMAETIRIHSGVILWAGLCLRFVFYLCNCLHLTRRSPEPHPTPSSSDTSVKITSLLSSGGRWQRQREAVWAKPHEPKKKIKQYFPNSNTSLNSSKHLKSDGGTKSANRNEPRRPNSVKSQVCLLMDFTGAFFSQADRCGETKGVTITTVPSWLSWKQMYIVSFSKAFQNAFLQSSIWGKRIYIWPI